MNKQDSKQETRKGSTGASYQRSQTLSEAARSIETYARKVGVELIQRSAETSTTDQKRNG